MKGRKIVIKINSVYPRIPEAVEEKLLELYSVLSKNNFVEFKIKDNRNQPDQGSCL